jgi:hypothetical protein
MELKNRGVFRLPGSPQPAAARALDRRMRHAGHPRDRLRGPLPLLRHTPLPPLLPRGRSIVACDTLGEKVRPRPFTRDDAVQAMLRICEQRNHWERISGV